MLLTVFGVLLVTMGLAIGWYGLRPLLVLPRLVRTEPLAPSEVTTADSFVVCRGIATGDRQSVASPFTGTRCLGFEFEVTERQPFGLVLPWFHSPLDNGISTVPFRLADDTGRLAVNPAARRFSLDTESTVVTVGAAETPPDRIRRFVDIRSGLAPVSRWLEPIPGLGTRRYIERRIDVDEEYVVAGHLQHRHGETVLSGDLVIADRDPKRILANRLSTAAFPLLVAIVFVSVGTLVTLM